MRVTIEPLHQGSRVMRVRVFIDGAGAAAAAVEFTAPEQDADARVREAVAILRGPCGAEDIGGAPPSESQ